ncbi:hypothetical protein DDB_G0282549 [Dictyostelium discoideum AX4]|uniref:16S rRNA (uracil(1498)-N(3))-methyltransferase n=1 Tax=Dictyostelium discoideum TaxID=44689 RepID=Q54SC0_DICDI|nr:hypothetical protein DDB_G0282549 [Dictyostelium discoideum AX4]EAL66134.1 hypothetical protein DDB_G0282549 [Dictyostelium discoideum AX4]|eukprot:XP_640119.1 hypothetical protein DDB_G0282549 [Dictyostelium discoideum AX4]
MRRFFINNIPFVNGGSLLLSGQQHSHLKKSLRLKVGNVIEVFDSNGQNCQATIIDIGKNETKIKLQLDSNKALKKDNKNSIINENSNNNKEDIDEIINMNNNNDNNNIDININIDLATSLPKIQRAEWMIEKLTEIGVKNLFLLESEYSKSSPSSGSLTSNKLDRFERIIIESSKQSKNNHLMNIIPPQPYKQFLKDKFNIDTIKQSKYSHIFLFDPNGKPLPLIFNEIKENNNNNVRDTLILIGPEGGFTNNEINQLQQTIDKRNDSNFYISKLGNTILRMETAAIVKSELILSVYMNDYIHFFYFLYNFVYF